MTVHQLPVAVAAFTGWLSELAGRLEPGEGWYGVFAARDPDGMRACFDGAEILPWDVAESLLHDLGEPVDGERAVRGRALHQAAATAHDRGPGGAAALVERRELMTEEVRHAEDRIRELTGRPDPAHDGDGGLAWARDDHARATARIAELTARLARLAQLDGGPAAAAERPEPVREPESRVRRRRGGGARYAGAVADPATAAEGPGGGLGTEDAARAARAAGNAVYALRRLRAQGRSGDAHALLCEALAGPPGWLPVLADELAAAGLGADWATLLWEAGDLPPARLAAVAAALGAACRPEDRDRLLRQGAARPAGELAAACAALRAESRHAEVRALLDAFVGSRTADDTARLAAADPAVLLPELRAAARSLSRDKERELLHALRVAGLR
ncbi:UL36 very large tegument protein [Streptomyces sp. NPDC090025]|uniref:UL36 very large tegument protein n=1 Tax=Streptomyces sp. NPDC090025 TaxID=3365922 RepID=UPI00383731AA